MQKKRALQQCGVHATPGAHSLNGSKLRKTEASLPRDSHMLQITETTRTAADARGTATAHRRHRSDANGKQGEKNKRRLRQRQSLSHRHKSLIRRRFCVWHQWTVQNPNTANIRQKNTQKRAQTRKRWEGGANPQQSKPRWGPLTALPELDSRSFWTIDKVTSHRPQKHHWILNIYTRKVSKWVRKRRKRWRNAARAATAPGSRSTKHKSKHPTPFDVKLNFTSNGTNFTVSKPCKHHQIRTWPPGEL